MPDELLDVVSHNDTVIGRQLRSVIHERGLTHRGVHVFLFTPDGRLLVQQRSRHRDTAPLALDCSLSEHVKSGEDFIQAALRGLNEELGIVQPKISRVVYFTFCYGPNDNKIRQHFEGVVRPDSVHFDPQEVERVTYHSLPELLAIRDTKTAQFSIWFEQLLLWYGRKPCQLHISGGGSGPVSTRLTLRPANPALLARPNALWTKQGVLLGNVVGPVAVGILFYGVVTPLGILIVLPGKIRCGSSLTVTRIPIGSRASRPALHPSR